MQDPAAYEAALEAHRDRTRDAKLASLGAHWETREGFFIDEEMFEKLGTTYEVEGRKYAVVGYGEPYSNDPEVRLARQGEVLHMVESDARAIAVPVRVCGPQPCSRGRGAMVHTLPISIALQPGERLGEPIVLHYDFWWAQLGYTTERACPPPPPSARAH